MAKYTKKDLEEQIVVLDTQVTKANAEADKLKKQLKTSTRKLTASDKQKTIWVSKAQSLQEELEINSENYIGLLNELAGLRTKEASDSIFVSALRWFKPPVKSKMLYLLILVILSFTTFGIGSLVAILSTPTIGALVFGTLNVMLIAALGILMAVEEFNVTIK